jgi:hypothetical protein
MATFDHEYYIQNNPDIIAHGITTREKALGHYRAFGRFEKRPVRFIKPKYYFSVLMMFKDEESILQEWLEYYLLIGTDHFYLFNHGSTDKSLLILKPYIERGLVTLNNFTRPFREIRTMLNTGLQLATGQTRWLAIIDSDEFIVPKTTNNIKDFLKDYEAFGGLGINWQMFGTSNVDTIPPDKLMIEVLTQKAPTLHDENKFIKPIVQPLKVKNVVNQHTCNFIDKNHMVTENKTKFPHWKIKQPVSINKIQLNHYFTRDKSYLDTKAKRRKHTVNDSVENTVRRYNLYNGAVDTSIQKYVSELRTRLNKPEA